MVCICANSRIHNIYKQPGRLCDWYSPCVAIAYRVVCLSHLPISTLDWQLSWRLSSATRHIARHIARHPTPHKYPNRVPCVVLGSDELESRRWIRYFRNEESIEEFDSKSSTRNVLDENAITRGVLVGKPQAPLSIRLPSIGSFHKRRSFSMELLELS